MSYEKLYDNSAEPIEVSTDAEMNALLVSTNEYNVYKFTGTSEIYTNGDLYIVREGYAITNTLSGVSAASSNPSHAIVGNTTILTFTASDGYALPASISVSGASYTWNQSTGKVTLLNPTGNISITITGTKVIVPYITVWSPNAFVLLCYASSKGSSVKGWDGTMEYSTDKVNWTTWTGDVISAVSSGEKYCLYVRGTGNTYVTAQGSNYTVWVMYKPDYSGTADSIHFTGNIETLLDYQTVVNGQHPTMATAAFEYMFYGSNGLVEPPELGAVTLTSNCYYQMFIQCTGLTVSDTSGAGHTKAWRIPTSGTFTNTYGQTGMFSGCAGTRASDAMAGAAGQSYTYYIND